MFQQEFEHALERYALPAGNNLVAEVQRAYSHPDRYYHTLEHLDHLVAELKPLQDQFSYWATVVFAIAYHDFVYNSTRKDNEEKSAAVAVKRLKEIAFPEAEVERCKVFILATKKHEAVNREVDLFTDADLSILGAVPERYHHYAACVRKEYSIYPDLLYKPGRKKVLLHFLEMKQIFKTAAFYEKYEHNARRNLLNELEELS